MHKISLQYFSRFWTVNATLSLCVTLYPIIRPPKCTFPWGIWTSIIVIPCAHPTHTIPNESGSSHQFFHNTHSLPTVSLHAHRRLIRERCELIVMTERVRLSVCSLAYLENHVAAVHQILCVCCLWPWLSHPLVAL